MKAKLISGYGPYENGSVIDVSDEDFAWLKSVGSARELTQEEADAQSTIDATAASKKGKSAPAAI